MDSLPGKINLYGIKNQSPLLFIHFDKTIYSNNENVWFTAYLFNADYSKYKTLSLALIKDDSRAILMEDRFVISNGLSFGNTFVPDTVGPGNYTFIATTNRLVNGKPDVVFTQPVTIKTGDQQSYTASLNPIDTSVSGMQQKVMLLVNFSNTNSKEIPLSVPVSYYVGNASQPVLKDSVKTQAGQYIFNIPSKLLSPGNNNLHVQIKYKKEVKDISMALPVAPRPAIVRFYPEGGNLVNNLQSIIGWEVKTAAGNPMGASAVLYQDTKVIDAIETNSYGIGKFQLTPKGGSSYFIKLYANKKDTLYKLPTALTGGPSLSLTNAIANDTLTVNIKDEQREKLYLTGHNYKQVFFTTPVNMTTTTRRIKFILKEVPKGLAQLTLTDSLGRPFAERVFFAHYDQRVPLKITPDKNEYTTREKVNVKVKLDGNMPDSGFVSVACVQENRIEIKKKNDLESYFYLTHDLGDLPARESYLDNSELDRRFLENVLLVKTWSRYTWTDVLKAQTADTVKNHTDLIFKGIVTLFKEQLKTPVVIANMKRPLNPVNTDQTGHFTMSDDDLLTESNKKTSFIVEGKNTQDYQIHLADPYEVLNKTLAKNLIPKDYSIIKQETTQYIQLPDNEHAIHLKEVKIKGDNDDSFFGMHANPCGDYVCRFNILNCPNHRTASDNRPAVAGEIYLIKGQSQRYWGCWIGAKNESVLQIKGIYDMQEFYPSDYSQISPPTPEYISTIFWKHQLKVSSSKESEFSFYTSDITGRFKIVVQGITGKDVTYGESTFNVVKAK